MSFNISELTEVEKREIMIWTGNSADNGEAINQSLRTGRELTKNQFVRFSIVKQAIQKSKTTEEITLYRVWGRNNPPSPYKRKKEIIDCGIMEASLTNDIVNVFSQRKFFMIIRVPKGTQCLPVMWVNGRDFEQGVLFLPNTRLLVEKIRKNPFKQQIKVYCSVVSGD